LRADKEVSVCLAWLVTGLLAVGCARDDAGPPETPVSRQAGPAGDGVRGNVTISGDDRIAEALTWRVPEAGVEEKTLPQARLRADAALRAGNLHEDETAAIPLYLGILRLAPDDAGARAGIARAAATLVAEGDAALAAADDDAEALRTALRIAAVLRRVQADDPRVQTYLARVDAAERAWQLNREAERDLRAGQYGAQGGGALGKLREVLRLRPGQARALQGIAAVESGLIRRAEEAGAAGDFSAAERWLALAAGVRPGSTTIDDARLRLASMRSARIARLRDEGLLALPQVNGIPVARRKLDELLRIAAPGDAAATELRNRIDLATHYGLFRPGQVFTDAFKDGSRGPKLVVVPHGGFRMGAGEGEADAEDHERPARYVRFGRGFAMSVHEVTVGEFRRYLQSSRAKTRAGRRGYSMAYDERSGNFIRRSGVGPHSDYLGAPADDDMPVLHVSARDADAYAQWLTRQTGRHYRLPSEAEFEYALRAARQGRFPWGNGAPPAHAGNLTGSRDRSPGGRTWNNAFAGHGDGYWGPAPVGRFVPNAYGLHDLAGNVSEWVADCWHDSYRRAPEDGSAWVNPGCRTRVVRGGSWASSPAQSRSAWRAPVPIDTTNARIGFRVVREL
jgi:formylglycine-generating enzyme required for sulfatase activity